MLTCSVGQTETWETWGDTMITSRITSKFMHFIKNGKLLMQHDAEMLVPACVTSSVDYCNSLLIG